MGRKAQGRKITKSGGLGRSLINQKRRGASIRLANPQTEHLYVTNDGDEERNMNSVMERNDLDEFLNEAILKESEFKSEKSHLMILGNEVVQRNTSMPEIYEYEAIAIPRRPHWQGLSKDELNRRERQNFLAWRKRLAEIEEGSAQQVTPFEKNLEIWRQLWRVVDRSHVLCQIVDARNPLLFRCQDLEDYVNEVDSTKKRIMIINKADFLSSYARQRWADYLTTKGIDFIFFSAHKEQVAIDKENQEERQRLKEAEKQAKLDNEQLYLTGRVPEADKEMVAADKDVVADQPEETDTKTQTATDSTDTQTQQNHSQTDTDAQAESSQGPTVGNEEEDARKEEEKEKGRGEGEKDNKENEEVIHTNSLLLFDRDQLLERLTDLARSCLSDKERAANYRATIGMVGYPNVGKSSTINVLMGCKKVSVAATPGKTKHFQTLLLNEEVCLCDCPGLVFPTFLNTREDLVINGIYPIDQLRSHRPSVQLVCDRVSRSQIALAYALRFPGDRILSAAEFLHAHARMCGFSKKHGEVDESRSARIILKDMVAGKLLHCHPPPGLTEHELGTFYGSFTVDNLYTPTANNAPVSTGRPGKQMDNFLKSSQVNEKGELVETSIEAPTERISVKVARKRMTNVQLHNVDDTMLGEFVGVAPKAKLSQKEKKRLKALRRKEMHEARQQKRNANKARRSKHNRQVDSSQGTGAFSSSAVPNVRATY